ncbi:sulfotransferase [Marichromatium purpuratum 984]|uniref:Sulfotransferase n=2 Tax=Marichromatium purpuratum TaxID=37487 RepID=W0E561_MARPU|nr:sulfotransferase [Marichromatium purpuratum 984]
MTMTTPKPLDFCIIGAQKSGTTSLFRYLEKHPRLYLPPDKELPFFSRDDLYAAGWPALVEHHFQEADSDRLWGTASPQYMTDPRVPGRIAAANPDIRLVAILRNPIDRAFSHFTMSLRRGMESRDFAQAAEALLQPDALARDREAIPPDYAEGYSQANEEVTRYYFVWSEYARALDRFLQHFPKDQLLVLYMEDMQQAPQKAVDAVLTFLGLPADFQPPNLGKVYHKGGGRLLIPAEWREWLKRNTLFRAVWDRVPPRTRGIIDYWYDQLNVRPDKPAAAAGPTPQTRRRLAEHFTEDVRRIETLVGKPAPWRDFAR